MSFFPYLEPQCLYEQGQQHVRHLDEERDYRGAVQLRRRGEPDLAEEGQDPYGDDGQAPGAALRNAQRPSEGKRG